MKSGVTCDFWLSDYVIATRAEFSFDRVTDSKAVSEFKRGFRHVLAHLSEECDQFNFRLQEVGGLSALGTQTAGNDMKGRQKRKRCGQVNDKAPYRTHYPSPEFEQSLA